MWDQPPAARPHAVDPRKAQEGAVGVAPFGGFLPDHPSILLHDPRVAASPAMFARPFGVGNRKARSSHYSCSEPRVTAVNWKSAASAADLRSRPRRSQEWKPQREVAVERIRRRATARALSVG